MTKHTDEELNTTQAAVERLTEIATSKVTGKYSCQVDPVHLRIALERIKELERHLEAIAHGENLLKLPSDDAEARAYNEGVDLAHSLAARARRALSATPPAAPSLPADRLGAWMSAALDDPKVCDAMKADIRAWFASGQGAPVGADVVALNWLAARPNCELSHGYDDPEDEGSWRVHRVNGGINDREWTLIGSGSTPLYAIQSAMEKDAKPVTMLVDQDWLSKHTATDPDSSVEAGPDVFADRVSPAVAEQTEGEG